jgi:polysaccharide export outer membrane protein
MDTSRVSPSRVAVLATAALVAVLAACGPRAPNYVYKDEPDPRNQEWIIGVGDRLGINVWENEALTTEATVRPDGTITMPLVGDLKASGLTPTQLKQQIKTRLADFVKQSEITVAVLEVQSYRFTIAGEVQRPGVYSSAYLAGNFTRFADSDNITLHRRDPKTGEVRKIPFVYGILAKGSRPDMNIVVLPGDSIFVP